MLGTCVYHVAAQGFVQTMKQMGQYVEMSRWTQGDDEARETAMARRQAQAEEVGAEGVVGVRFSVSNDAWGMHTLEFYCDGTAIRQVSDARTSVPAPVVPMP